MSNYDQTQEGFILKLQRTDTTKLRNHTIDENQFRDWQSRWNSKAEVIDQLLSELERTMIAGKSEDSEQD